MPKTEFKSGSRKIYVQKQIENIVYVKKPILYFKLCTSVEIVFIFWLWNAFNENYFNSNEYRPNGKSVEIYFWLHGFKYLSEWWVCREHKQIILMGYFWKFVQECYRFSTNILDCSENCMKYGERKCRKCRKCGKENEKAIISKLWRKIETWDPSMGVNYSQRLYLFWS